MRNAMPMDTPVTWLVTLEQGTPESRGRLVELLRPDLERTLATAPETREASYETPFGRIHLHRQGDACPGAPIRLTFGANPSPRVERGVKGQQDSLPSVTLPDGKLEADGARLVGLEDIHASVLQQFHCRWDGALDAWSQRTGQPIPTGLHLYFAGSPALFVFAGDPGTGKSVSAAVLADRYCRMLGITGHLVRQGTEARGNGTVGDFGNRVRTAFDGLARLPADDLKILVLEEAESIGMRRSEGQAHQEDRAGTATLLQCLDTYGSLRRFAVFCTTNLLESLDAALIRRAMPFTFARPGQAARRILLAEWLPDFPKEALSRAVDASDGMTGSDLVRALTAAFVTALRADKAVTEEQVLTTLRAALRTGSV
jgi:hypothetical protein